MSNPAIKQIVTEAEEALKDATRVDVTESVQFPDIAMRLGAFLAVVFVGAIPGWQAGEALRQMSPVLFIVLILGLVLIAWLVVSLYRRGHVAVAIGLAFLYAAGQGWVLGALSSWLDASIGDGIVQQAVTATVVTFLVVVGFSQTELGRRTGRARKMFMYVIVSYLIFSFLNLILAFSGVGDGWGFNGLGLFGILVSLVGCVIAAWSVNIDVTAISDTIGKNAPVGTSWMLAFSLTVSILWLYLEILRLLAVTRR